MLGQNKTACYKLTKPSIPKDNYCGNQIVVKLQSQEEIENLKIAKKKDKAVNYLMVDNVMQPSKKSPRDNLIKVEDQKK